MPSLQAAFLCNAASVESSGLVSVLGAFVDGIQGTEFPITQPLTLVVRVRWGEADYDVVHPFELSVERTDDQEQVVRINGTVIPEPPAEPDPDLPLGLNFILPFTPHFRREGLHSVIFRMGGEEFWRGPLKVRVMFPRI